MQALISSIDHIMIRVNDAIYDRVFSFLVAQREVYSRCGW